MTTLHKFLQSLKSNVESRETPTYELLQSVVGQINATSYAGVMRTLMIDSLGYVLDVAVNQGTSEDIRELTEALENGGDFGPQPDTTDMETLPGQLCNFSYTPDYMPEFGRGLDPIQAVVNEWISEVGSAAVQAVLAYVAANWEEEEEEEEED